MLYAQVKRGQRLHLVYEAGEGPDNDIVRKGFVSAPLCNRRMIGNFRMTINLPLANACRNCRRIHTARQRKLRGDDKR